MKYALSFRRLATREFDEAADYYDRESVTLGVDFVLAVREALDRIIENPFAYAIVEGKIRATPTHRFPYVVYFRVDRQVVTILSILHSSRDPAIWKDRT